MAATIEAAVPTTRRSSARAVAVVSSAHFASHFYMLRLPPLFPLLREVYGVGYTELGLAISVFSIVTECRLDTQPNAPEGSALPNAKIKARSPTTDSPGRRVRAGIECVVMPLIG